MARQPVSDADFYEDPADELLTGEAVALDLRPTSFVLRSAGAIIDFIVYFGVYIVFVFLMLDLSLRLGLEEGWLRAILVSALVLCIVVAPTAVEILSHGKSLGKLAIGARIVRDDGGAIGFRHAFIRALTGVLEVFMTFGGFAALVALLNSRSKRLGDLLAGTYSQNERVSRRPSAVFGVPVELTEWAKTADVAKMPDSLARRIAHFLGQASNFNPQSRERLSRELAREVSVFVSPIPQASAEHFLAAVVAIRRDREYAALQLEQNGLQRLAPVLSGLPHNFPSR